MAAQHRFRDLVNSIEGIVWEADAQTFQFLFVSQQAQRVLGYEAERWLNEPTFWKDHIHPDARKWAVDYCMAATAEKRDLDFEYRMMAADGRSFWMRDIVTVLAEGDRATRPIGTMIFLGPTGSGKTHVIEAVAEALFGDRNAVVKIDCAEVQRSHEISELIGSPPGYLGHRETSPLLTQENLSKHHTERDPFTLMLFDEIEKASDALWQVLLGVLGKATITLGDNRRVDFSQTMVFMTSNLGAQEMSQLINISIGFAPI